MKTPHEKSLGCPYRLWGWHDGGPDYTCDRPDRKGYCCENSWDDYFICESMKKPTKERLIVENI